MHIYHDTSQLEAVIMTQRPHLLRLCARLTSNSDAAEDLTQETLLEAWRHLHALRDPTAYIAWLNGIARNVCLRWLRRHGRESAQCAPTSELFEMDEGVADACDLETELERNELAMLLDRAMALLPPQTRAVLVQKYIEESPQAEIATRLGMSEGAVAMRLQRGKLALRRVLSSELRDEAEASGMNGATHACWQQTNLWCPHCGQQRLSIILPTSTTLEFQLRCPNCTSAAGAYFVKTRWNAKAPLPRSRHALINNILTWTNDFFRARLREGSLRCTMCNKTVALHPSRAGNNTPTPGVRIVGTKHAGGCPPQWAYSTEMALYLPEGQRFWQQHRRIRALPEREVEHDGRTALLTRFERLDGTARLEVLSALPTYEAIHVYETNDA